RDRGDEDKIGEGKQMASGRARPPNEFWSEFLELRQQTLATRNLALAGGVFDVELFDDAVLDEHRIALRASSEAVARTVERHVDGLGKFAVAVRQKIDLAFGAGRFLPGFHYEYVIDAGHRDRVDALRLDGRGVVQETGNVKIVAGRCECAGHCEKRDLAALENFISRLPDRTFGRHDSELGIGQSIADLDRHGYPLALRKICS